MAADSSTEQPTGTSPPPSLAERFTALADTWERETHFISNSEHAGRHPAHREIIGMGPDVVPLILKRMEAQGGHWFMALSELTGAHPVPREDWGRIRNMQAHWLKWGREQGLI